MEKAINSYDKLNVLVNCAGISEPSSIEDATFEHWKKVQSINSDSVFLGCHYGVKAIKENGEPGSIVNISSSLALRAGSMFTAYCASKASVTMLTKCVALHCAEQKYPIRCNSVHPGAIHTPMLERYLDITAEQQGCSREQAQEMFDSFHPMGHCGQPEDIANGVLYLASDESKYVTGTQLSIDGGHAI